MIAYVNFNQWPTKPDQEIRLIKLIRKLKPQSISGEIEYEKPIDRNRLRDDSDAEHGQ